MYEISEYVEPRAGKPQPPRPVALGGSSTTGMGSSARHGVQVSDLEYQKSYQDFYVNDNQSNIELIGHQVQAATLPKVVPLL